MTQKRKRALVCGASRGIGKAIAKEFASQGHDVLMLARDEESLKSVLAELDTDEGQDHKYLVVDFMRPDKLKQVLSAEINESAPFHILVNNSGGPAPGPLHEADIKQLADGFTMHILASQELMKLLLPGMKKAGYGRIINIISTSVKEPIDGLGVSNTIRGAMASWSKTLSKELAAYGITVNNVLPGYTETGRLKKIIDMKAVTAGVEVDVMSKRLKRNVPAGRFAQPEEIAKVVGFLGSEAGSYINGVNIPVDGGRTRSL